MKENLSTQMVHEAELTRQHARYKIPAWMEIDGKIYKLYDWSVSGCGIIDLPEEYLQKKFAIGVMIFKFNSFETRIENIKLEFVHKREERGYKIVGARFTELTPQQLSILNTIITAYIEGDIVTQDDILVAVQKAKMVPKKIEPKIDKKKAYGFLIMIYSILIFLLFFLGYVIYNRIFIVHAQDAFIDTNLYVLRSPTNAYINFQKNLKIGTDIKKDEIIGIAHYVSGGNKALISPIAGKIFKVSTINGQFKQLAEPILTILPKKHQIFIRAKIIHSDIKKIKIGDNVIITLPNGKEISGKIKDIYTIEKPTLIHSSSLQKVFTQSGNYDEVIIIPNEKIKSGLIGKSVYVKINTFRGLK